MSTEVFKIGVLKEPQHDPRVSVTPETTAAYAKLNVKILIEKGAGERSFLSDESYKQQGADVLDRSEVLAQSDLILAINRPDLNSIPKDLGSKTWIGMYQAFFVPEVMQEWAAAGQRLFSMDALPRTTRAQSMDVLSSQANIAGYKAVLLAATEYPRYFPMFMTAAGSIPPAKVLILGAGVAGLQAIATARRLGAVVEVFDTRPAVKEEVMSLGAKFVEVEGAADASQSGGYAVEQDEAFQERQKAKIAEHAAKSDIIITTAQIPGRKAPILITKEMIDQMRAGSIIIDLASATGGNTELTQDQQTLNTSNGVRIIGNSMLYNLAPADASKLYAKNIQNFLKLLLDQEGGFQIDFQDDLVKGCCITHEGKIVHERMKNEAPA
ncbi:MAG TPA: Re/Si-specific NAD(P)(+) transhydrogenase subunit alpha [Sphingobacteriaceae bacterium]|nr:Re/Si-specific NAD(P)(+) transhydrogenase subunit alpha [Sphingobacteriaceae bacterium]